MRSASSFVFAILVALVGAACGGAPVNGQGNACQAQADCDSYDNLTCTDTMGDPTLKSCERLCTTAADCPNDQPCESYNLNANLPKFCQVNPG